MKIAEVMTRDVVTVPPDMRLRDVAALLTARRISGVPVRDEQWALLGVVSESDILRQEQDGPTRYGGLLALLLEEPAVERTYLSARTAGEAMTAPARTVKPTTEVAAAARIMIEESIKRLPVLASGELVGIVTRADLVRAYHRPDSAIAAEIADDVLLRTLWIPDVIDVAVVDGEVTLSGEVETRTQAELVDTYVRRVPGVVDVRCDLGWRVDDLARRTEPLRPNV
jgi:CBS domain-containing protein